MFDWVQFVCLTLACLPGIVVTVPGTVQTLSRIARDRLPTGADMPEPQIVAVASTVQSLLFVAAAATIGTFAAPRANLHAPFFEALSSGAPLWPAIRPQLLPSVVLGSGGALIFVAAYYLLFRPRLDAGTVSCMEGLRNSIGIWGRVLYGGIVEEVVVRWGLMSLLVWLTSLLVGGAAPYVVWGSILVSGLLFGLGHAPGYLAVGCRRTPMLFATMIALNLWGSILFGWLFWQYGLLAAMVAHALFHLVWLPFDLRFSRPSRRGCEAIGALYGERRT